MEKVEKIYNYISDCNYTNEMKNELINKFGCIGENGNFIVENKYTHDFIRKIAKYLSEKHGILNQYSHWYCNSINKWRLVFGRS
jgi:hypothetical protein